MSYRIFLFVLFTMSAVSTMAQSFTMRNQVSGDLDGQRITAFINPVKKKVAVKNDVIYYYYHKGKFLYNQGGYAGYLLSGEVDVFSKDHRLVERGQYTQGVKVGTWKKWHVNGLLKETSKWRRGRMHGIHKKFNTEGKVIERARFKRGKMHGKRIVFENGKKVKVAKYRKGVWKSEKDITEKVKKEKKQKGEKKKDKKKLGKKEKKKSTKTKRKNKKNKKNKKTKEKD